MGKIFISGKITGDENYIEKFTKAEELLTSRGYYDIVNPAIICSSLNKKTTTWQQLMDISETLLGMCDAIFMIEGWEYSTGASIEHATARANDIKVIYERDLRSSENKCHEVAAPFNEIISELTK